jgi:hypothetical protein
MSIYENVEELNGKAVLDWDSEKGLPDPQNNFPRIGISYDDYDKKTTWIDRFSAFLDHPDAAQVTGVVIGAWDYEFGGGQSEAIVEAIASARDRLPRVEAIFYGDITSEECEISWIQQSDVTPILVAYPALKYFAVRGGTGLHLGHVQHNNLQTLIIQTGGLDAQVVRSVLKAELPALEHLELWLGDEGYGATTTIDDLQPLFSGELFPNLKTLGLRNSQIVDDIAKAIVNAPILSRIQTLDLSMGTLTDEGAAALLESPAVKQLQKLDLHHHFCSQETTEKLQQLPIEVDVSEALTPDDYDGEIYRYVAVSE